MKKIANENFVLEGASNQKRLFNIQARKAAQEFLDSEAVVSVEDLDSLKQAYTSSSGVESLLQQIKDQSEVAFQDSEDRHGDTENIAWIISKQENRGQDLVNQLQNQISQLQHKTALVTLNVTRPKIIRYDQEVQVGAEDQEKVKQIEMDDLKFKVQHYKQVVNSLRNEEERLHTQISEGVREKGAL